MILTISEADLESAENHGSVILFQGSTQGGKTVRFGVDHRVAGDLINAVSYEGWITVEVEGWQIFGAVA